MYNLKLKLSVGVTYKTIIDAMESAEALGSLVSIRDALKKNALYHYGKDLDDEVLYLISYDDVSIVGNSLLISKSFDKLDNIKKLIDILLLFSNEHIYYIEQFNSVYWSEWLFGYSENTKLILSNTTGKLYDNLSHLGLEEPGVTFPVNDIHGNQIVIKYNCMIFGAPLCQKV